MSKSIHPNLQSHQVKVPLTYVNRLLGLSLQAKEVTILLGRMRYGVSVKGDELIIEIPCYRTDILHPIDVVEDVAIAYGYENFTPQLPDYATIGIADEKEKGMQSLRELMIGLGFTEAMSLVMSNTRDLYDKMMLPQEPLVTAKNPVSEEHAVARSWLLPSLMIFCEKNKNQGYPQRVFEMGICISEDGSEKIKLAGVIAHAATNLSEIQAVVGGIAESMKAKVEANSIEHPSFIPGRCAKLPYGMFGELHPQVLTNFKLEVPATAFEVDVSSLLKD